MTICDHKYKKKKKEGKERRERERERVFTTTFPHLSVYIEQSIRERARARQRVSQL
jgi:hypothetical protein